VQTPPILFNLARTEQLTGRPLAAAEHFRAYLALPEHPRITSELRAKAQEYLTAVNAQLGHLKLDAPADATVTVDGKRAEPGATIEVVPGLRKVAGRRGEDTASLELVAPAGTVTVAHLIFSASPGVVPPVVVPPVPLMHPEVAPPPPPVEPVKEPYWTGRRTAGVVISGVGVVGLVLGGVFGGERGGDTTSANNARSHIVGAPGVPPGSLCFNAPMSSTSCSALSSALSSNNNAAQLEESFLIGGGVLLAIGLVTTFWPSSGAEPPMPALAPMTGPHLGGLQWSGSF
jgi:hypothetical protein